MVEYTKKHAGCYVDGARGIYSTDAIVDFARDHGVVINRNCECDHAQSCFESEFASCEFIGDYEDEADNFMNKKFYVSGYYWGRNDGDWGLWENEED